VVDVSMRGTFNGIRSAAPVMVAAGGGSIVNVASVSGVRPTRGEAPYSAAKAAVIALTQSAALEYGPTLRVNCVSPGLIETELTAPLLGDEKVRAALERRTPLGRVGTVEDVAAVITFLCSDMASYVTGVNLVVDGGSVLPSSQVESVLTGIVNEYEESQ
jgi:NAD(P)-dependent dehydrogenase (short-subunit alcohol dehydrogenase family)